MGNACSDITPTFDAQKKLEDDKASLTRDLVMDEEASSKLPMTFQARYKMGDILGKGAFSTVRLGTSKINNKKWAVKAVARKDLPQVDEDALRSEVAILRKLPYRHIVYCKDFFEEASHYYMVLEYMEGGELFDRVVQKTYYSEEEARNAILVILKAINFMHSRHIVHRDLKPENLLLASKKDDIDIKIADFGFAIEAEGETLTQRCGTPGYVAPEIIEGKKYGKTVDMWALGVICYILLGGYPPFHDENQRQLFIKIKNVEYEFHAEYWGHVSTDAKDLIASMLTKDTTKRITAGQALAHPWIRASPNILSARNLKINLQEMKQFNKNRRFKALAKAVIAVNRLKIACSSSGKLLSKPSNVTPGDSVDHKAMMNKDYSSCPPTMESTDTSTPTTATTTTTETNTWFNI